MMAFDKSIKIAPSILSADFSNFGAECEAIERGVRLGSYRCYGWSFCSKLTFRLRLANH